MKLKLSLLTGLFATMGLTGALAYGVYSGCGVCGAGIAGLWGVLILVALPIGWGFSRSVQRSEIVVAYQATCKHEYASEECQEVLAWHGDNPIWCTARARRCWKCAQLESKEFREIG